MGTKKHKPEEVVAKLRQVDVLVSQGQSVAEAIRAAVAALLSHTPVSVDEIIRQSGLSPATVQTVLLELELGGRVVRHAGGRVGLV